MKVASSIGGLFVGLVASACGVALGATRPTLGMEVWASHPASDRYELHVKLINTSDAPVSFENHDIPWHTPNELVLIPRGIRLDAHRSRMAPAVPLVDYMFYTHTLAPGESLEGHVSLQNMFHSLLGDVEKYDVIIEWKCKSKQLILKCHQGSGGTFLIHKGGGRPTELGGKK